MKDAVRPDSAAAAQRVKDGVKDLARGALGAAGDLALDVAEGYRKSTRYFRMRVGVVASWVLLSLVTLWAACPSSGPANSLGAKARLDSGSIMGNQVYVENESDRLWKDVVLTLEGGWRYDRKTLRPGDKLVVPVARFQKDGAAAPATLTPRSVSIECSEGSVTTPLLAR